MASIETAIKHFESKQEQEVVYTNEVLQVLHFLKQAEENNLNVVGIGYVRHDGVSYQKSNISEFWDKGFVAVPKKSPEQLCRETAKNTQQKAIDEVLYVQKTSTGNMPAWVYDLIIKTIQNIKFKDVAPKN